MYSFFYRSYLMQYSALSCSGNRSQLCTEGNFSVGLCSGKWKDRQLQVAAGHWWWRLLNAALAKPKLSLHHGKFLRPCYFQLHVLLLFYPQYDDYRVFGCLFHKEERAFVTATESHTISTEVLQRISCSTCPEKSVLP